MTCINCNGRGKNIVPHNWSDGWGMVAEICVACKGTGDLGDIRQIVERMTRAEAAEAQLTYALRQARISIALYFHYSNPANRHVNLGLKHAPNPSPYAETWLENLKREAKLAERTEKAPA
jgi:hypothetical protein